MELSQKIEQILEGPLAERGYSIVRILLTGSHRRVLQIMIERQDGAGITIEDCTNVSRLSSVILDVEDPIKGAYYLEVSSPGLDRPLVKHKDFVRFCGHQIMVKTQRPMSGRRRFLGHLESVTDADITLRLKDFIETEDPQVTISFLDIRTAHLYMNDDSASNLNVEGEDHGQQEN